MLDYLIERKKHEDLIASIDSNGRLVVGPTID